MRGAIAFWSLLLPSVFAQPLVVASCETERQVNVAQKLIEQAVREGWRRELWEKECRQQGFEVVGDSDVIYLVPVYCTPAIVEQVVMPVMLHISGSSSFVQRLNELPPAARSSLLDLLSRPNLARFVAQEPSVESLRTKLEKGEILIGIGDLWVFEAESEDDKLRLFAESRRFRFTSEQAIQRLGLPPNQVSGQEARPSVSKQERRQWHFVFSHSIPRSQQIAHIAACLEWLKALEQQLATSLPEVSERIWKIFYPNKQPVPTGGSYSLSELQSLIGTEARLLIPTEQSAFYAQKQFSVVKWEVGIELIKLLPDGNGVSRHFVPLEVLLGLRDY